MKIGDKLKGKYEIIQILDKRLYNMYLCVDNFGFRTTFTDLDFLEEKVKIPHKAFRQLK